MSAFVIFDIEVHDAARFAEYRELAPPAIAAYGGRYLARGGATAVLEGAWPVNRLVVLEFPSRTKVTQWLESPEYREARALRHCAATTNAIVVDGL